MQTRKQHFSYTLILSLSTVYRVLGFDHLYFDIYKDGWHEYSFPYKLGGYRKVLRTAPAAVMTFNYSMNPHTIPESTMVFPFVSSGPCDCVAIWVDYDLDETHSLRGWRDGNFAPHCKVFVRFLPTRNVVDSNSRLEVHSSFSAGDSDIQFAYSIRGGLGLKVSPDDISAEI